MTIGAINPLMEMQMMGPHELERFVNKTLHYLRERGVNAGKENGKAHANGFILKSHPKGTHSWMILSYPVISNVKSDVDEVIGAFDRASELIESNMRGPAQFAEELKAAFAASPNSESGNVLLVDLAREWAKNGEGREWKHAAIALFAWNMVNWKRSGDPAVNEFELIPATLNQAHGPKGRAFYLPRNSSWTASTPFISIRRRR